MTSTFSKCANLTEVDLSNTNFPLLKNMVNTFEESRNLKIINLSGSTFPALTNIQRTFRHCNQIEELDLSGFNTTKVTSMVSTFGFDENLKTIYVSNNWSIESLANEDSKKYTFHNCNSLNNFSASKETADYATLDSGYLTLK